MPSIRPTCVNTSTEKVRLILRPKRSRTSSQQSALQRRGDDNAHAKSLGRRKDALEGYLADQAVRIRHHRRLEFASLHVRRVVPGVIGSDPNVAHAAFGLHLAQCPERTVGAQHAVQDLRGRIMNKDHRDAVEPEPLQAGLDAASGFGGGVAKIAHVADLGFDDELVRQGAPLAKRFADHRFGHALGVERGRVDQSDTGVDGGQHGGHTHLGVGAAIRLAAKPGAANAKRGHLQTGFAERLGRERPRLAHA
jgi:hypothetical protein